MLEVFKGFVSKFDLGEGSINRKYKHSLRVQKICEEIAKSEKLSKSEFRVASIVGLLHDYGRFYQWDEYKTFIDSKSVDHGDLAVEKLFDDNEIKDFYTNEEDYIKIYEAIKYHNKYEVPDNVKSKVICDIIRDADKLDIIYMFTIKESKVDEDGDISESVKSNFNKHKLINNTDVLSGADELIRTIALAFDLNFNYSYKYLKDKKIFEKIFSMLKEKDKFKPYFDEINEYIERKIGD